MAEQTRETGDDITSIQPAIAPVQPPVQGSPKEPANEANKANSERRLEPLSIEEPRVRTKLRVYAILVSLCVCDPM